MDMQISEKICRAAKNVYQNESPAFLVEKALEKKEGVLADNGALVVDTGKYTGRLPKDRFFIDREEVHDKINFGEVNQAAVPEVFYHLRDKMCAHLAGKDVFIMDGFAGADSDHRKSFRVITEQAAQSLFAHQLLRRPTQEELVNFEADFTVIAAPSLHTDPKEDMVRSDAAILIDFREKTVLIAGTGYSGEIKKSIFTIMNFLMPEEGVFPMHCSANISKEGKTTLFFGLSGTGKTTLSADPACVLIGDDEHGWGPKSVFNFEGGCYAKCVRLSQENEPDIYDAIRFGTLVENVTVQKDRTLDFDDTTHTENTRAGYPIHYIHNASQSGMGNVPSAVIFLTADAYGVLPPISILDSKQAVYYFLSGFTSKLAGTEVGITDPVPTFSSCFGAPFLPLRPICYAKMLQQRIDAGNIPVYLVNTGWNGSGKRIPLKYTRAMVTAAINGTLQKSETVLDPFFGLRTPASCPGVPDELLCVRNTWSDTKQYEAQAKKLAEAFRQNEIKLEQVPADILAAGPHAQYS